MTLSKQCAHCGKTFYKKSSVSLKDWREKAKFCSRQCYWDHDRKPLRTCAHCGKSFHDNWIKGRRYCSAECSGAARRKPLPRCERCGKPCKKHNRRFCCRKCKVAWYHGDRVYNYLGPDAIRFYDTPFWKELSAQIRIRDKVCQRCGAEPDSDRALQVHHIVPREISQDDSPSNLIALCASCHAIVHAEMKSDHEFPQMAVLQSP